MKNNRKILYLPLFIVLPEGISLAEGRKLFGGRTVLGGFENGNRLNGRLGSDEQGQRLVRVQAQTRTQPQKS